MAKTDIIPFDFNPNITYPAYLVRNRILRGIERHIGKLSGNMLDFGCGSKPYRSLFKVDNYIGLDFQGEGHSHENEQIDVFYDGKKIPFPNEHFDAVFSTEVFEHVYNLEEILIEINRVMKKDGLILITCPFAICEHEAPNDFARYTSYALKHLMEEKGFEVITYEKLGNSIETITQLWLSYIAIHITPHLKKIPLIHPLFKILVYTSLNTIAILLGKILPKADELYLNNLILCKKVSASSQNIKA